jgi:hypothetical protein
MGALFPSLALWLSGSSFCQLNKRLGASYKMGTRDFFL